MKRKLLKILEDYDSEKTFDEEVPTWSHEFEEGPPKLEEHELEAVDRQSRKTEIERLMDMTVLKAISEAQATSGSYKRLSTKIVYDWRHRDGQWKRRGRLVAREFRWLIDYDLAALFSPTGVASTVKLLSALFVSTDHRSLGSVDIGDACLQVEQDEPTIVEVDGEWCELGYTLPGQRTGSSAWFNKRCDGSKTRAGRRGRYAAMSKSLAGVAYSAVRAVQEVGQEGGKIARKIRQTALPLWFRARAGVKHAWRGVFCRARSPGGRAGSRKNCKQNPANCAAAVLSRARRRFSMGVWT